jgi:cob(I)alamin adenosyltransferase
MARSIATRTGDGGTTGLLYGQRVPKDHPQIEAVGCLDEFSAALGHAKATCADDARRAELERIQRELVSFMGEVACAEADTARFAASKFSRVTEPDLARVDAAVAASEARQVSLAGWATPGANLHAAALDTARAIARRAERRLTVLPRHGKTVRPLLLQYLNRVSDLLWLMAREAETKS